MGRRYDSGDLRPAGERVQKRATRRGGTTVAKQLERATDAQEGDRADAIRAKELINVGGMAWVFSMGSEVNGRIILPDAANDRLGLKNAHIYAHPTLGDFVAFAVDYQSLGSDTLVRQGWALHPFLRPSDDQLNVTLEGKIIRLEEDEDDEGEEPHEPTATEMGSRVDLQLVGPAPVCFKCDLVHPEGPVEAHEARRAHLKEKIDGMLGEGWDDDLDEEDGDDEEDDEPVDRGEHTQAASVSCPACGDDYRPDSSEADRHQFVGEYQIMTMPRDRTPNWDAGRAHIDGLERTPMSDWPSSSSFVGPSDQTLRDSGLSSRHAFWASRLRTALRNVELAWQRKSLHFNRIDEVRDADILVTGSYLTECIVEKKGTGAMAWVNMLEASGVSRTIGFDD